METAITERFEGLIEPPAITGDSLVNIVDPVQAHEMRAYFGHSLNEAALQWLREGDVSASTQQQMGVDYYPFK